MPTKITWLIDATCTVLVLRLRQRERERADTASNCGVLPWISVA